MLVEQTTVPAAALPVEEFKDHLRLGTGFADDSLQDELLESFLRAAISAIEARTGKILIQRDFTWTLTAWRELHRQVLPVAPVAALSEVKVIDGGGAETIANPESYHLRRDTHTPAIEGKGVCLPRIPQKGGSVEVSFVAGYGPVWSDLPPDLGQAVFLLGAHYYDNRAVLGENERMMPFGVSLLIDRHRRVRLFGEVSS
jgi:uncharacterized phiE125 gp8 family phage protein